MDYIFRRLALDFLPVDTRSELGILTAAERAAQLRAEAGESDVDFTEMRSSAPVEKAEKAEKAETAERGKSGRHRSDGPFRSFR
jgi:ribonucleoside-diphosphate reductase alpha chain